MPNPKTPADDLFERYLSSHGLRFVYEPDLEEHFSVTTDRKPDYLVFADQDRPIVCEVKQLATRTLTRRFAQGQRTVTLGDRDQFGPLRASLIDKAEQLKPLGGIGVPLVIVLAISPEGSDFPLDDEHVIAAMWGNPKVSFTIDRSTGAAVGDPVDKLSDYGAFCSLQPDGSWANVHPHITAVVALHERTHERDWIEDLYRRRRHPMPDLMAKYRSAIRTSEEIERAREAGEIPEGAYQWVDVYDTDGAHAVPLPPDVFAGERDRYYGFHPNHSYGERPRDR